jgi:hypothetical protein
MSYATMNHAEWIEGELAHLRGLHPKKAALWPEKLNEFQAKVADILGIVGGGIYNAPINPEKIDWSYGFNGVSVVWKKELATWDFNALTLLMLLCHAARIRCSLEGCGPRSVRLSFWPRKAEGNMSQRHPNIAQAVEQFEQYLPNDHRVRYQEQRQNAAE